VKLLADVNVDRGIDWRRRAAHYVIVNDSVWVWLYAPFMAVTVTR